MLYALCYAVSALTLAGWFYYRNNRTWSTVFRWAFFGSFALYAWARLAGMGSAGANGVPGMVGELLALAAIGLSMQWLLRFPKYLFIGLSVLVAVLAWYVRQSSVERITEAYDVELDPNGEWLVELREGADLDAWNVFLAKHKLSAQRAFYPADATHTDLDDYYVVNLPQLNHSKILKIKKELEQLPLVEWTEENEIINVAPLPGKGAPDVKKRFGVNDPGVEQLWGFDAMGVDKLYSFLNNKKPQAAKKARIAILDTGVDASHEDLKANFVSTETASNNDPRGHGTHCAGIAGAVSNNGIGVASFSQDNKFVSITSIKVLNGSGMGTQQTIIAGMLKAADTGADVLSMSLGGPSNQMRQRAYEKAVKYANDKGGIVVVAAGNSNKNAKDYSPANTPGVIAVSAVDEQLNRAFFSNTVSDLAMGIAAPGVNIYSTIPGNQYASYNGTSMATPYVAGLIGLLKSIRPQLSTREVYNILRTTGRPTRSSQETGLLIQPQAALTAIIGK